MDWVVGTFLLQNLSIKSIDYLRYWRLVANDFYSVDSQVKERKDYQLNQQLISLLQIRLRM